MRQLTLWDLTIDLDAKLKDERARGVKVFYHFCGTPLVMRLA